MALDLPIGWEPWTAPALEDLLPRLSREEQVRLHSYLREHQRIGKGSLRSCSEGERDFMMIHHVRYALHHYNARHPGEEFDAVKPLMVAGAYSRGQVWYHLNFWACCRKTKKIKRFFAEVHYKTAFSALTNHHRFKELRSHPAALAAALFTGTCHHQSQERPPSSSSSSSKSLFPVSCAFCPGYLGILHPKGRKFVCGNDKDRMVQGIQPFGNPGIEMPFTCRMGLDSNNGHA
ncbi:hypothetical protein ZWY2020_024348 [Hordeum vulgare]|nr:hypothetical protein ZWY2020_024348 [Hordeum vulgare]